MIPLRRKFRGIFRVGIDTLLIYKVSLKRLKEQWIIRVVVLSLFIDFQFQNQSV
jgi:hypothetical protein